VMRMPPDNVRGRPLVTSQGNGPDAYSAHITTIRIADAEVISPGTAQWRVSDLPATLARRVTTDPETGCWRVGGYHDRDGYARSGGESAHRTAWRALVGEIPPDRPVLDHVRKRGCAWRDCCRPDHLEPVTARINCLRGGSFAAVNAAKTACDHGHPYDLYNTYYRPDGHRDCRACIRRRVAEYKQRQQAKADVIPLALRFGRAA
jgi:HNH endonuclease